MTTIEILRQAVAGEIENKFVAGEKANERVAVGFFEKNGEEYLACLQGADRTLEAVFVSAALERWTHVPTPQPEVIWEYEHPSSGIFLTADGVLRMAYCADVVCGHSDKLTQLAKSYASLHSSLKALEQERDVVGDRRYCLGFEAGWNAGLSEDTDQLLRIQNRLQHLSPYPREEKR